MSGKCCIALCPFKSAKIPLVPFPKRDAPNYELWVAAMHRAETNIQQLDNPLVCAMHFVDRTVRSTGKVRAKHYPMQYLSADEISTMVKHIDSTNHLVAEWLNITRRKDPDAVVGDSELKAKAKEVVSIMKLFHVDIDFGWIENFEEYARKNGIETWKDSTSFGPLKKKVKVKAVKRRTRLSKDLESITSINTYKQALEMVELLEEYVKRTKNRDAIELIAHMQEVIINTTE